MKQLRIFTALCIMLALCLPKAHGQNISTIAKSDPLIITGAVGTQNTYHYSSAGDGYASPLSNMLYANLNISLYGFNMPFSFCYSNSNMAFSYPQLSFNLTPTIKNWTGHIGLSNMAMSNYVMNMSFNGVGLEYNSQNWRIGAFYGQLRNAISDDPTDPFARSPQYKRMGWGFKAGYGSSRNGIDIYLLRAYDCINSIDESWRRNISPQENIVVGVKGQVSPTRWISLSANAASSVFSKDTQAGKVPVETDFDKIFDVRYSSLMRFAGDANVNLTLPFVNATLSYRLVQPDYTTLGSYYLANNYQSLALTASTSLFKKISLSGTFSGQADNLSKQQLYTTCGYVYNANAGMRIGNGLSLNAGYSGYLQTQCDGAAKVDPLTKVSRAMNNFSFTPTYSLDGDVLGHSLSISASLSQNKDLSKSATGESDVNTKAAGLAYGLNVKPWKTDFSASVSHQQTYGYNTRYTSDVGSLTTSRSFLENQNLNVAATVSMCYNHIQYTSKNLSIGCDFQASYTLKEVHAFSASAAFSKYGDVNITKTRSTLDCTDITLSLNYAYTFTLLDIKRKANKTK